MVVRTLMTAMRDFMIGAAILGVTSCAGVGGCSASPTGSLEVMAEFEYAYADIRQHEDDPIRVRMLVNYMNSGSIPITLPRRQQGELISDDQLFLATFEMIQHEPNEITIEPGQFVDVTYEKIAILGTEGKIPCDQKVKGLLQLEGQAGSRTLSLNAETTLTTLGCSKP